MLTSITVFEGHYSRFKLFSKHVGTQNLEEYTLDKVESFLSELGQSEWDKGIDGVGHGMRRAKKI